MDDGGIQSPDGKCEEKEDADVDQKNIAVFGSYAGYGDVFAMYVATSLKDFFIGPQSVGGIAPLVVLTRRVIS